MYLTQITEDGDIAVLSGSNQLSVSDKVIRGGVKIQKRDLETSDTKGQMCIRDSGLSGCFGRSVLPGCCFAAASALAMVDV